MTFKALCPAKINTFLAVGPPDRRGWHPLRTVFQAVSLADELAVEFGSERPGIECDWDGLPEANTLSKTLRLAMETAVLPPMRLVLTKKIPVQSGLGGGSSDAGGLLRILRRWLPEAFPPHVLADIAVSVGADVPFFLAGGRAKGEGYGEILAPLPDQDARWITLAQPEAGRSTADAYRDLDAESREWRPWPSDDSMVFNDFEKVAAQQSLDLIAGLRGLGGGEAGLTGSGSAVFAFAQSEEHSVAMAEQIKRQGAVFAASCRTLTREESLWTS